MTVTLRRTWKVGGVLTDVTTAKLSDPTGTYGVKRDDTSAVVVADGTAMTKASTGVYEYSFSEPSPGLSYTGYAEFVYGGLTYYFEHDITAAVVSDLHISYSELRREISRFIFGQRDATTFSGGSDEDLDLDDILRSGLRSFYWPAGVEHQWSFLRKLATITTVSGTRSYALPTDFGGMLVGFTYASGLGKRKIARVSEEEIRSLYGASDASGDPEYCAIRAVQPSAGGSTTYEVLLYPVPTEAFVLSYRYAIEPGELSLADPYHLGGAVHSECVLQACLMAAEKKIRPEVDNAVHAARFAECLQSSIKIDAEMQ